MLRSAQKSAEPTRKLLTWKLAVFRFEKKILMPISQGLGFRGPRGTLNPE